MENLTEYKELKKVELKLEELTAEYIALLDKDKGSLTPSERRKVDNYDSNLAELKADKAKWNERLDKAQGIVQVG
jgi:predicted nuclease with TOPRIM domain